METTIKPPKMPKQIFVNLPVKDLKKSVEFFTKLGFSFDQQFTDRNATCMVVAKDIYVMLLVEKFFRGFTPKELVDAKKSTEVLIALSVDSREDVDDMITKAVISGGKEPRKPQDHGWMYSRSFEDVDGHIWEILWMDESAREVEP